MHLNSKKSPASCFLIDIANVATNKTVDKVRELKSAEIITYPFAFTVFFQ